MKTLFMLFFCGLTILTLSAQSPSGFNYQGVARDNDGIILENKALTLRLSLLSGSGDGVPVYSEMQEITTNPFGVFAVVVGRGEALAGNFSEIDWSKTLFIQTEAKWKEMASFVVMGRSELLSVPYALHAASADMAVKIGQAHRPAGDSAWLIMGNNNITANHFLGTRNATPLAFRTNNIERMRIMPDGYVGINNTNPSAFLEIYGSGAIPAFKAGDGTNYAQFSNNGDLTFKAGGDYLVGPNRYSFRYQLNEDYGLFFNASLSRYEFRSAGSSVMTGIHANNGNIYTPGNIGIAEWNPAAKLHVNGNAFLGDHAAGNFAEFGTNGSMRFVGTADYLVGANRYAFRFLGNPSYGLFFNSTQAQYQFLNGNAVPVFRVGANTGAMIADGSLTLGDTGGPAGTIRWTGTDFEGNLGSSWASLTSGGGGGFQHYIGELFGGGIVVAVWKDVNNVERGLIASLTNISTSQAWSNVTGTAIGPAAQDKTEGQPNTLAIIAQPGHAASAALICNNYTNPNTGTGVYSDWYLPSIYELKMCFDAVGIVNKILPPADQFVWMNYHSSTEGGNTWHWFFRFANGDISSGPKTSTYAVRAVRQF